MFWPDHSGKTNGTGPHFEVTVFSTYCERSGSGKGVGLRSCRRGVVSKQNPAALRDCRDKCAARGSMWRDAARVPFARGGFIGK